ncbi:MAG TPA: hypothetical protein VMN36_00915 [Verrucomicrobiales bacterium]|nr:hypothetical protein [Verrucomicrobiales bacterium]
MSIARLRRIAFGAPTEKTATLCPEAAAAKANKAPGKTKAKGHGRRRASSYAGAKRAPESHPTLKAGDVCPDCQKGKLRTQPDPAPAVEDDPGRWLPWNYKEVLAAAQPQQAVSA